MFADEANVDNPMTMIVKPGENKFDGTSIATNDAFTTVLNPFDRAATTITDLSDRAEDYAGLFTIAEYPIYVEYTGSTTATIEFAEDLNTITLDMEAKQGRINIVFEAEQDLKYRLTATLKDADGNAVGTSSEFVLEDYTNACGFIFNEAEMEDGSYVNVVIEKNSSSGGDDDWEYVTETGIDIATQPGVNLTHLINFDGSETSEAGFTVTFDPITDSTDNTQIN